MLSRNIHKIGQKLHTNKNWNILDKSIFVKPVALKLKPMLQSCKINLLFNFRNIRLNSKYFTLESKIFLKYLHMELVAFMAGGTADTGYLF